MREAAPAPSIGPSDPAARRTRIATALGVMLAFASVPMALSGTTIAMPAIARELGGNGFALNWVLTGYFATASSLMLVAGTLGDVVGRRRVFAIGAGCFGIGALASATAGNIVRLDLARTVSGVGSACLMAAGGAVLGSAFDGPARTRVFAGVGTMVGAGLALGPGLAGIVVGQLGWRALFGAFAAVSIVLLASSMAMPRSRGEQARIDLASAASYIVGFGAVMVGVLQATDYGWADPRVLLPIVGGAGLLVLFIHRQRRAEDPLLDLALLADPIVAGWLLAAFTLAFGTLGALTQLPVFLQATGAYSPEGAGIVMLAMTLPVLALPPAAAALVSKGVRPHAVLVCAVALIVVGNLALSQITPRTDTTFVVLALLVIGTANGIVTGLIDPQTLSQVPPHRLGMGSGLLNTVRAGANTITLAVVAAILITLLHTQVGNRELAVQIAAGTLTDTAQVADLADALRTTLLIVAVTCAISGTAAIALTNPAIAKRASDMKANRK